MKYLQGIQLFMVAILWMVVTEINGDELDDFELLSDIADAEYRNISDVSALDTLPFVHDKTLVIEPVNLNDPWVSNQQCHANFPLFPALQIAFTPDRVRSIQITRQENVKKAWIEGPSVQMEQTSPESRLCFESENRVFHHDVKSDTYLLRVGPYFLKLFDGYFPLRIKLKINYPDELLELVGMTPNQVKGAEVSFDYGEIRLQNVFEGRLELEFKFRKR